MSKKPENKDELNIQELLKNSGVESMLDLNKLIGKIKKHFIESTLDAEFDEHMGYQKHNQNSRDVSFMLFNNLWFKCWFAFTMALVTVFINWILINKADLISKRIIIEDNKKK